MEETKPEQNKPNWVIGDLYRQAWEIIKTHKVLWLFSMAAGGAGVGIDTIFNNLDNDIFKNFDKFTPDKQTGVSEISRVLGESTSYLSETLFYLFSATPLSFYFILAIEFLLLIIIGVSINLVYNAWSTGSLLSGIQAAITGDKPTIKDSSEKAIRRIKPLIWLAIVPMLVLMLLFFAGAILPISLIFLGKQVRFLSIILTFLLVFLFLLSVIAVSLAQVWAQRRVVVDEKPAKESLFAGLRITRKKFWSMLLLGIVNNVLILLVVGIPIGIIAGIFIGGFFTFDMFNTTYSTRILLIAPFIITIVLLSIFLFPILGGIINAFKATVWSLAYNNIREKYDK